MRLATNLNCLIQVTITQPNGSLDIMLILSHKDHQIKNILDFVNLKVMDLSNEKRNSRVIISDILIFI